MELIKKSSLKNFLFIAILIIIFAAGSNYGQSSLQDNDISKINTMTDKLVKKLLLTGKQEKAIKNVLSEFFKELRNTSGNGNKLEELRINAEKKILNLIDNKQKMKFEIIKDDWWKLAT